MKIGIIGTGAYAIALTSILENKNRNITMWTKLESEYKELKETHQNTKVSDYKLNEKINFTMEIKEIMENTEAIILAIPAKFVKGTISELKKYYQNQPILIATKGLEANSKLLLHDFLKQELKTDKIACISGPTFAKDILKKETIGLTIASNNQATLLYFETLFSDIFYLTIQTNEDIIGCELCGILKNIMAIFSGILDGIKVSHSTNSKFLVDASLEIQNIIHQFGGNPQTFNTYAGLGDLILTCTSMESRNYTFGKLIGENKNFKEYIENTTIEGLENLNTMYHLLREKNISSSIIDTLYQIIYLNKKKELIFRILEK